MDISNQSEALPAWKPEIQPEHLQGQAEAVVEGRLSSTHTVHGLLQSSSVLLGVSCRSQSKIGTISFGRYCKMGFEDRD